MDKNEQLYKDIEALNCANPPSPLEAIRQFQSMGLPGTAATKAIQLCENLQTEIERLIDGNTVDGKIWAKLVWGLNEKIALLKSRLQKADKVVGAFRLYKKERESKQHTVSQPSAYYYAVAALTNYDKSIAKGE